jgi:acetyl-CoA C-acetyltransferase
VTPSKQRKRDKLPINFATYYKSAPELAARCIEQNVKQSGIDKALIEECYMGNVLSAGIGQAPARQAALFAKLPHSVCCTTLNRVCGSGIKSVMLATQVIQTGSADVVIAGGMENMSKAPYLLEKAREGYRLGNGKIIDSMVNDGLWDVYNNYHMGSAGELCAKEKNITRIDQDNFAKMSYQRALEAIKNKKFQKEITPVDISTPKESKLFDTDEEPFKAKLDKLGDLKPAFDKAGTITAANASSLSDGASTLLLCSKEKAASLGLKPIAKIVEQASHAQAPEWFTTAPVGAVQKLLKKAKLSTTDIDLYEINEAFSVVSIACMRDLKLSEENVNVRGGAVALGHPIGASGARILTTLIHTLHDEKKKLGLATLCIGGGEASALLIEAL